MGTMTNGFTRLTEQFLVHIGVERGLATATVTAYESDIAKYIDWLETRGIHEPDAITKQDVEDYIAALDQAGESARSKARRLASIHEFHRFALGQHAVTADVSAAVKAPKGASTLPDVLTVDEVTRLLDAAAAGGSTDPVVLRDKALLEFMYATGCRVSEATGVNLDDIDLDEHIARLMGKGSKQRLVPLGSYACRAIPQCGAWRAGTALQRQDSRETRTVSQQTQQAHLAAIGMGNRQSNRGAGRHHQTTPSAHLAPFLRHAPDPRRRGRAHRAGTARARQRDHHADLHARKP